MKTADRTVMIFFQATLDYELAMLWFPDHHCREKWVERAKNDLAEFEDYAARMVERINDVALLDTPIVPPSQDEIDAYEDRKAARVERLQERAQNVQRKSSDLLGQARKMACSIPFGQPVLIGHHSEGRDRRYRARIENKYRKGFEEMDRAQHLEERAEAAANNTAISGDDPAAIVKLQEKIAGLKETHAREIETNKRWRKMSESERVELLKGMGYCDANIAYMKRQSTVFNVARSTAEIKRCEQRIIDLQKSRSKPAGIEIESCRVRVIEDVENNRLKIVFPGKPSDEVIAILKSNGFRWSPSVKAWQRQLTSAARYAATQYVLKAVENRK